MVAHLNEASMDIVVNGLQPSGETGACSRGSSSQALISRRSIIGCELVVRGTPDHKRHHGARKADVSWKGKKPMLT